MCGNHNLVLDWLQEKKKKKKKKPSIHSELKCLRSKGGLVMATIKWENQTIL